MLVDTLGLIWALVVLPADVQDRDAAKPLLNTVRGRLPRLSVIWADGAYAAITDWVQRHCHWLLTTMLEAGQPASLRCLAEALDRRTNICLAGPLSTAQQGL